VLVKLPPEDKDRELWTEASLNSVVGPLLAANACDGFVAVNTSTRLAVQFANQLPAELPGGISGEPLRGHALRVVALLRRLVGPVRLVIGCGGVMAPEHAVEFVGAGADLVELYSGMIYAGPRLVGRCARKIRESVSIKR
jgi:dihydroorotate dehydrogenase